MPEIKQTININNKKDETNKENNSNNEIDDDKPPELEIIKSPLVKLEEEKQKIIDNKKEEININNGVKIEIKE